MTVNGEKVHKFNKPLKITLKVDMTKIKNKDKVGIYYFNEETNNWEYVGGKLNDDGLLVVELDHFSKYIAMEYNQIFDDVVEHWAKDDIEIMAARHIAKGITADSFEPDSNVTRAEFTALLVRALGLIETGENEFTDVSSDSWYFSEVNEAYNAGIISGITKTQFAPDSNISREEMATMIMRAYEYSSGVNLDEIITTQEIRFNDQDKASSWGVRNIILANAKGFMNGYPNKMFKPKENATRAEAIVF